MTREDAIRIIEKNRPTSGYIMLREALDIAVAALRAQAEAEGDEPLTMAELKEMDGEPVWDKLWGVWGLVDVNLARVFTPKGDLELFVDGATGRLYRHKPKEVSAVL